jgi:hypothetical protein
MADQRMVGSEIRRRMGAPSSHLGAAKGWDPAAIAKASVSEAQRVVGDGLNHQGGRSMGTTNGHMPGVADDYSTGETSYEGKPMSDPNISSAADNLRFVSAVSASRMNEPMGTRGNAVEYGGPRLTVSPSMKNAETSPAPTQGQGKIVPNGGGRSRGMFNNGASEEMGH